MNSGKERRRHVRSEGLLSTIEDITYETLRSLEEESQESDTIGSTVPAKTHSAA